MGTAEKNRKDHTEISGSIIIFWIQYRKIKKNQQLQKITEGNYETNYTYLFLQDDLN